MTPPLISLSIVSHGDGPALRLLLESLARYEALDQMQLLVTDNLGDDLPDVPIGGWHSRALLRPQKPRGFAANHNAALECATAQYFCVLNPDVAFEQPVFRRLLDHLVGGAGHIVAPLILDASGRIQDSFRSLPAALDILQRRMGRASFDSTAANGGLIFPDWIAGTFMLMQASVFAHLGGFDARYRLYFEDVDLCTRARLDGLRILVDSGIRIRHDPRRASGRIGVHLLWHARSALRFLSSDVYRRARGMDRRA